MQSELREKLPELPWDSAEEPRLIWKGRGTEFSWETIGVLTWEKKQVPHRKTLFLVIFLGNHWEASLV